uniref:Cytochrome c oxidase cbb3-type subunit 4 n=1 Tax=Candidatus Kentrum sp. FM TaxID=2126340 RepID=A0A450SYY9_9GAMM|nr:MAG: cytochrome c oxidase cbb3-type subunit 4 [Candidatus Kentron sp. FM]VFJ62256.1 MAG: cytochrome c oxidase cbb3-type subunit 4 [Candidatus Kentron sp. FM]VFK12456.1 MAG: cytochrome c oxidase cbb3-type subunit 4 [Candidatus Kentron sp. FM]
MNSLKEYFHTDWGAMTTADWIGMTTTVVAFLLMVGLYVYVLRPKNREKLEMHRDIPVSEDGKIEIGGK